MVEILMNISVGQKARRSKHVTAADVEAYAQLTGDRNPLHFDEVFAAGTRFGRLVAQGGITTGLLHALVATDLPGPGTVFLNQSWQFTAPVYIGDTITAEVNVLDVHDAKPVTHLSVRIWQQDGQTVLEGEAWCYTFSPR
jgi:acyl dehydratase